MLVDNVFFWIKEDVADNYVADFKKGLEALTTIPSVKQGYWGIPASTDRPVIERSYSFCLTTIFEGMEGHDEYQVHPIHKEFLENFKEGWEKVMITDSISE